MSTVDVPIRCDLYLRLSDGRDYRQSMEARENTLRREVERRGWTVHRVVIENDLTPGKSRSASAFKTRTVTLPNGLKVKRTFRPGFRSVLDDLAADRVQALFAEDLDRVARVVHDGEDLLDHMEAKKASADSLSGTLRLTDGGTDKEIDDFRSAVLHANRSSKDTARRVRAARERQADEGIWGGGRRPYGFTPVSNPEGRYQNTQLSIKDSEAAEIVRAAGLVLSGVPLKGIARDLNDRDVPTVTGTKWSGETVRDILLRPLNAGVVVYQGKETAQRLPGEPILPVDTWRGVVDRLTDPNAIVTWTTSTGKTRKMRRGNGLGRAPKYLGTNLYRCLCGSTMEIQAGVGRVPAYRCARNGGTGTVHVTISRDETDAYVTDVIVARLSRSDAIDLFTKTPESKVDVAKLRREAAALRATKARLARMLGAGTMDEEDFAVASKENKAAVSKVDAALAAVTDRSVLAPFAANRDDVRGTWERMSLGERREIIRELCTVTIKVSDLRGKPQLARGTGFDRSRVDIQPV